MKVKFTKERKCLCKPEMKEFISIRFCLGDLGYYLSQFISVLINKNTNFDIVGKYFSTFSLSKIFI